MVLKIQCVKSEHILIHCGDAEMQEAEEEDLSTIYMGNTWPKEGARTWMIISDRSVLLVVYVYSREEHRKSVSS